MGSNFSWRHLMQYGVPSLLWKDWPAKEALHPAHTKHSLCHFLSMAVTTDPVMSFLHFAHFSTIVYRNRKKLTAFFDTNAEVSRSAFPRNSFETNVPYCAFMRIRYCSGIQSGCVTLEVAKLFQYRQISVVPVLAVLCLAIFKTKHSATLNLLASNFFPKIRYWFKITID